MERLVAEVLKVGRQVADAGVRGSTTTLDVTRRKLGLSLSRVINTTRQQILSSRDRLPHGVVNSNLAASEEPTRVSELRLMMRLVISVWETGAPAP